MSKIELTAERIREAAKSCGDANRVLRLLFPQVFDAERLVSVPTDVSVAVPSGPRNRSWLMESRSGGQYEGHAFILNETFDWAIEKDDDDYTVLVPRIKKEDVE